MDNKSKQINISNNLLVGLKAELLRKQGQCKTIPEKSSSRFQGKNHNKVSSIKKKFENTSKKAKKKNEPNSEELQELEKSRKMLEKKVKLYEQMKDNVMSMDDSSKLPFLVDFEQKVIDDERHRRSQIRAEENKKNRSDDDDDDAEWVDYVDGLGRSRRCLRKDPSRFKEMDEDFTISIQPQRPESISEPHLLSNDMRRELEREKWEEAMKELNSKDNIHYSDVVFNEIRDHGVGFFGFAKDDETRLKQMELLKQLREQTKVQRKMFSSEKEKRRKMLEIKLAKIMQRKVVQEAIRVSGLDAHALIAGIKEEEWSKEMKAGSGDDDDEGGLIGSEVGINSHMSDDDDPQNLLTRDDSWKKDAPVREWDVGKKAFDEDVWLNKRRDERISEFAPTYNPPVNDSQNSSKEDMVAINLRKLRMLIS